jgi:hypothetical protein
VIVDETTYSHLSLDAGTPPLHSIIETIHIIMAKCSGLPKGLNGSGRPVKGLPYAVQNISVQFSVTVDDLLKTLRASIWTVIVPGVIVFTGYHCHCHFGLENSENVVSTDRRGSASTSLAVIDETRATKAAT